MPLTPDEQTRLSQLSSKQTRTDAENKELAALQQKKNQQ